VPFVTVKQVSLALGPGVLNRLLFARPDGPPESIGRPGPPP
jgi:hypothetical protein